MKVFSLVVVLLATLAAVASTLEAPPASDQVFAVYTIFGQNTNSIVKTGLIDSWGDVSDLVTNFVYTGLSSTFDGISTFDQKHGVFYYATDVSSAFLFGVDVNKRQLAPPIDFGVTYILDVYYNLNDENLYVIGQVNTKQDTSEFYYSSYSTNNGSATLVANFTQYLDGAVFGHGAINTANANGVPSDYLFVSSVGSEQRVNVYNAATQQFTGTPITGPCTNNTFFNKLYYNTTSGLLWGIQESIPENTYSYAQIDPVTGKCTAQSIEDIPAGVVVTAITYSPASGTLYFARSAGINESLLCSAPVSGEGMGAVTCKSISQSPSDLEVQYFMH